MNCLLNRINAICCEQEDRDIELEKLKIILIKNQYPEEVIQKEYDRFKLRKEPQPTVEKEDEVPKQKRFIVLPYANYKCEDFSRRLKQLVTSNFPQVEFNVAYQTPKTIAIFF